MISGMFFDGLGNAFSHGVRYRVSYTDESSFVVARLPPFWLQVTRSLLRFCLCVKTVRMYINELGKGVRNEGDTAVREKNKFSKIAACRNKHIFVLSFLYKIF